MSKKKSRTKAQIPAPLPEVTAEDVQKAKAFLAGLKEDVSYTQAKKKLKRELGFASEVANALIVRLNEEGFEKGDEKNWFLNPEAETTTGVVQGARTLDKMTVMPQCDAGEEIELPIYRPNYIPGDVFELRRSISGWRLSKFIRRPQKRWVCQFLAKSGEYVYFKAVSAFAPLEFAVPASEIPPDVNLKKDAVEVELLPDSETPGEAVNYEERVELNARFVKVVGAMNDPLGEMAIASAQFGVPIEFSPETLEEAKKLPDAVDKRSLQNRVDLTDLPFVTIDGEDARDFDDAVYCADLPDGGWRLLVAIADVSRYVKPGTSLDRDAQIRATSVYFPASVVPMLPEKLSNGLCSLNPGVDRLVMVCDAIVSPEGRTTAYQFYPGVIHSHARLTYNVVWSALQKEPAGLEAIGERLPEIERLHALFMALKAARIARGA
ncbi:MAG: RNB domain-containing ribonuclease, partial [Sutterella wadsworthensis]|nr:RNB domain-containing ribonuclease [Sutterella wadsworthensis]